MNYLGGFFFFWLPWVKLPELDSLENILNWRFVWINGSTGAHGINTFWGRMKEELGRRKNWTVTQLKLGWLFRVALCVIDNYCCRTKHTKTQWLKTMTIYYVSWFSWSRILKQLTWVVLDQDLSCSCPQMVAGTGVILTFSSLICGVWAEESKKNGTAEAPHASLSLCSFSPWYLQQGALRGARFFKCHL